MSCPVLKRFSWDRQIRVEVLLRREASQLVSLWTFSGKRFPGRRQGFTFFGADRPQNMA
jgi:hypothetical protein